VRILLLVPIYSLEAIVALCSINSNLFFIDDELRYLRKLYEAVVVFSFLQLVLVSAGGPEEIVKLFAQHAEHEESIERAALRDEASPAATYSPGSVIFGDEEDPEAAFLPREDIDMEVTHQSEIISLTSPGKQCTLDDEATNAEYALITSPRIQFKEETWRKQEASSWGSTLTCGVDDLDCCSMGTPDNNFTKVLASTEN